MKIIVFTLDYPPHRVIGAELAVHRLVKRLQGAGHTVEVRILADSQARHDGVTARPHNTTPLWNADVVITNATLGTRARNVWPHTPLVLWAHNNQVTPLLDVKESNPEVLVSNTRHMRDVFMSVNGQDSMVLYPIPDPQIQRLTDPGNAVTLINGSREKGGKIVAEVAPLLPNVHFLVVRGGHGPQVAQTAPNVEIVDHQSDLDAVWARTRVLIVPSHLESYSMVGFEALQRGIPVIGRALPGVVEALGGETWVRSRNPEAWAVAIGHHHDPLRAQHARARHVSERLDDVEEQVGELLRRLETL